MKNYWLLLMVPFVISCDTAYHRFDRDFPDFHWAQKQRKEFSFSIEEPGRYDLVLELSHFYDYPYVDLPVSVLIVGPEGTSQKISCGIPIQDQNGKPLGDCAMDICDLNFNIKNGVNLTSGRYKIVISNDFSGPYLPGIIGVGLSVEHS